MNIGCLSQDDRSWLCQAWVFNLASRALRTFFLLTLSFDLPFPSIFMQEAPKVISSTSKANPAYFVCFWKPWCRYRQSIFEMTFLELVINKSMQRRAVRPKPHSSSRPGQSHPHLTDSLWWILHEYKWAIFSRYLDSGKPSAQDSYSSCSEQGWQSILASRKPCYGSEHLLVSSTTNLSITSSNKCSFVSRMFSRCIQLPFGDPLGRNDLASTNTTNNCPDFVLSNRIEVMSDCCFPFFRFWYLDKQCSRAFFSFSRRMLKLLATAILGGEFALALKMEQLLHHEHYLEWLLIL